MAFNPSLSLALSPALSHVSDAVGLTSAQNSLLGANSSANQNLLQATGNLSTNSLFSPLREHSLNSSVGAGAKNNISGSGLPKTPVISFGNISGAHTPLVSPLTMIREEELDVARDDKDEIESIATKLNRDAFVASVPTQQRLGDGEAAAAEGLRSSEVGQLATAGSEFKSSAAVLSSTPNSERERNIQPTANAATEDASQVRISRRAPSHITYNSTFPSCQIKAMMLAFPAALVESAATERALEGREMNPELLEASASTTCAPQQLTNFQREYLRNCVEESMDDFCSDMRKQLWHLHYDVVRSFQLQQVSYTGLSS